MNRPHLASIFRLTPLAVVLLCCAGCDSPFFRPEDHLIGPPPEQLREINTIDLQELSRAEPVTVEEAAQEALGEILKREPPATTDLSLSDVRAASLANNLDLKVELVNPSIAQATVDQEEAKFEATFFGSARQTKRESPTADPVLTGTEDETTSFDLGVRIPLRTGGTAIVNFPFSKFDTDRGGVGVVNPSYAATLQFSISQPLLRGGGIRTNTHSIIVAKYERKITNAQTKLEAIRILANADRA